MWKKIIILQLTCKTNTINVLWKLKLRPYWYIVELKCVIYKKKGFFNPRSDSLNISVYIYHSQHGTLFQKCLKCSNVHERILGRFNLLQFNCWQFSFCFKLLKKMFFCILIYKFFLNFSLPLFGFGSLIMMILLYMLSSHVYCWTQESLQYHIEILFLFTVYQQKINALN